MARIEHIGIAIPDNPEVIRLFTELLGKPVYKSERVESEGVSTYFIDAGGAKIELLEALHDASPIARFLEKRGPGVHHLAFEVDDLDAVFSRMRATGVELASSEIKDGADGKRVFFLHPRSTSGVLVEFCQSNRSILNPVGPGIAVGGRPDAPRLVIASRDIGSAEVDLLSRHFERACHVTVVARDGVNEPWPDHVEPGDLAIFAEPGMADPRALRRTGLPRTVVFVGDGAAADDRLHGMAPDMLSGMLAIAPTTIASDVGRAPFGAVGKYALLPLDGPAFSETGLSVALPLITRHLLSEK